VAFKSAPAFKPPQLKYLSAVINESMRMYPAASSGTIRITDRPISLAGHKLPAGQPVLLPFFAIQRSPRLWQDPGSFKPERFLAADAEAPAAAAAAPAAAAQEGLGDDDDYVDVAADLAADTAAGKDQDQQDGKKTKSVGAAASASKSRPTLELKVCLSPACIC
jgi:hypothetical protein